MPGPYVPDGTLITDIIHQIAITIQAQIPSISHVYEEYPDRAPNDNTVILPLTKFKVLDDSNGKLKVVFVITAKHLFRRKQMSDNITQAYSYVNPWLLCISAWPNQGLGGNAIQLTIKEGGVQQMAEAGQAMVGLVVSFEVLAEFNIPLT